MTTLDDILTAVRAELSEGDADFFTDDVVTGVINRGQDSIAKDCPWLCMATLFTATVKNASAYMLPERAIHALRSTMRLSSGIPYRLDYKEPDTMDEFASYTNPSSGRPQYVSYDREGNSVIARIWPAPSQSGLTLAVTAHMQPTPLSDLADISDLDPLAIPVLVDYCLYRLKGKDEEQGQMDRYKRDYEDGLRDLRARRMRTQYDKANINRARRSSTYWRRLAR